MSQLVSVIIPVYNAERHLEGCITSIINQSWKNLEIILVDDGSTDASLSVAKSYQRDNITVISQKNQGASVARNAGLKLAKGDYIQFLDADDFLSPDKISGQMEVLNGALTHLAICKTLFFFDGEDPLLRSPRVEWYCTDNNDPVDFLMKLYAGEEVMPGYGGMIQPNAWLTPKKLIDKAGPWNEFRCPDDDGEFFCRVVLASKGVKYSDQGVNYYRKFRNSNSLSAQRNLQAFENIVVSIDLKYSYLKAVTNEPIIDRIFARHYWRTGVTAYPQHRKFSRQCIRKAMALGYTGIKYTGGPSGQRLASLFGWKLPKFLLYYRQLLKRR